ncbi:polysaccharide biosynthesis C-terminal domain-containing protein [Haloglomus litoreum]|uniref:oligosaccharide flippase family protein n=1 Tax=Haloglomus litoreum TaxID=3034026 RepID=UPI0023E84DF9|nr:polysaccharide biosynthesis C-terminal domain-containing protein [Haloglomus sp. DT116]
MDLSRASFKLFLSKGGNALVVFAGLAFFTRQLDATQLGVFFLFQTLLGLLAIPADLGISVALEKRLSEGTSADGAARVLGTAVVFKLCTLAVVVAAVLLARRYVEDFLGSGLVGYLVVGLVLVEFSKLYVHAVRGELRVGETASITFADRFVWIGLGAALVVLGFGVEGLVLGLLAGRAVSFGWAYHRCSTRLGAPSRAQLRSLYAFSKYQTVTAVGGRVYSWMDLAFVGLFLAPHYVSAYEVAWQITLLVILVSKSIAMTLFPQVSRWSATADLDRLESVLPTALGFGLFVSIPALVGAAIYAEEILVYLFTPEYAIAAMVLVVLMAEKVVQSVNDIVEGLVRSLDHPELAARATVVGITLNVVLSPLLLATVGFVGAAIATTLSWLVNTSLHVRYLSRFVAIDPPYRLVGWYILASLVMGGLLVVVETAVPVTGLPVLLVEIGFGAAVYVAVSAAIPEVRTRVIAPGLRVLA